ncbi:E3 ubiquitin-protein ligase TRIP12 [Trypanosoma grayi]|uniref:E3 ubiquitin-protein ligase TRIP12 n=1 Tax=Trypanosoma grayi TaxID=71804 RepID=UPI0004F3FC42|nr:E3 ubiquitin-protein ligase TRIP12 [Trypanosoma grayi]KEG12995.1 E3 ubiquitin-protein ligase TRIP12 [Trypanosoma grayi]
MDAESGVSQRKATKEIATMRENISSDDEVRQIAGLNELCNMLSMGNSMTIGFIRPNVLVPSMLNCLRKEDNIDLMILAARALTYLVDAISSTVYVLGSEGGVEAILLHLQEVKDIELSEQCLTCVEKITQNTNGAVMVLQKGGAKALLIYVDFFSSSSQRKAWTSVAAMCRRVDVLSFHHVSDSLGEIRARVNHTDGKIAEKVITCLYRIILGVRTDQKLVASAFGDVCMPLLELLTRGDIPESTFSIALSLIGVGISHSTEVTRRIIESGLVECLLALTTSASEQLRSPSMSPTLLPAKAPAASFTSSPLVRPPPALTSAATGVVRERRLTMEQTKNICVALAGLLPKVTESNLPPGHVLTELVEERTRGTQLQGGLFFNDANYDEEDNDEEEVEETLNHEEMRMRITEEGIALEKNTQYSKCVIAHVCDSCGKSCRPGDWFRCNKCSDFDYCGQCLLMNWKEHSGNSLQHSFCDMGEVIQGVRTPPGAQRVKEGDAIDVVNAERENLYRNYPHLLVIILRGLPKMVALFNESETHVVRHHSLAFIDRAVYMASAEKLLKSGLAEAAVCEMIVAALTDTSIVLNAQVMPLCRKLLDKLPSVYISAFMREGVTNTLAKIQKSNQPAVRGGNGKAEETNSSSERLHTTSEWREFVASEAGSLLSMFPALSDDTRSERLTTVMRLLQDGSLQEAFDTLRLALLEETTSFELSSSNMLHELRDILTRANDVNVVIDLVRTLAKEVGNGPCALTRFVRHLQTVLSQLDQFHAPSFGSVNSIHMQIPVRLVPHSSDAPTQRTVVASKGAAMRGPPATAASKEASSRRPARAPSARTGTTTTLTSSLVQPSSSGHATVPSSTSRSSQEGREATVSVEPLTDIEALMSFVGSNVLPGGNMGRRRMEDEEQIEDVLPELGNHDKTEKRVQAKKGAQERPVPRVYLRHGSHVLPPSMTILQVLQQFHAPSCSSRAGRRTGRGDGTPSYNLLAMLEEAPYNMENMVTLHYSTAPFGTEYTMESPVFTVPCGTPADTLVVKLPSEDIRPPAILDVMRALHQKFPFSSRFLTIAQKDVLTLLGIIYEALQNWSELLRYRMGSSSESTLSADVWSPSTALGEFIHQKLNNKAMRHCSNLLLAGQHLSTWAVNLALDCNFLFTSTTRKFLFEVSFCGTLRSLVQMQENMEKYGVRDSLNMDHQFLRTYRLHRAKKRVWRDKALTCAMQIFGGGRTSGSVVLEFEYYNENGSGSGPTMEFYSLVSDELREINLGLWRRTDETPDEKYFRPHNGVYPLPLPPDSREIARVEPYFRLLGRFLARALLDRRILTISLSPVLLKMLRGDECGVYDLVDISESLGASIVALATAARSGAALVQLSGSAAPCAVEDLLLDYTLPGDGLIELKKGGANIPVTSKNLLDYCDAVTSFMLRAGVEHALKALRSGFHDYIPLYALRMLTVAELHEAIHGHAGLVTVEELEANCHADHGYTMTCCHVRQLFEIIASFDEEEQRRFFLFLTGSSHLPVGGLANMQPKFTIVRKTSSDCKVREQDQLPSAMTCQNYLKLPAYENKEQMEQKLRQAIDEGCGAFLLT